MQTNLLCQRCSDHLATHTVQSDLMLIAVCPMCATVAVMLERMSRVIYGIEENHPARRLLGRMTIKELP